MTTLLARMGRKLTGSFTYLERVSHKLYQFYNFKLIQPRNEKRFAFEAFKRDALNKLRNKEPGATAEKLFKPLFKRFIEEALQAEMDGDLNNGERSSGNRRNGKSTKKVKKNSSKE